LVKDSKRLQQLSPRFQICTDEGLAKKPDIAGRRSIQPDHVSEQRALAATGAPNDKKKSRLAPP
jgi:hypothetical protein